VFCQLETLRHCLPPNIPCILKELPTSLDETYERILKEIGTANRHDAYRLLQCLSVAIRPLRVEELAEILALDFDEAKEGIPVLKEDWRWDDQQEAVLSTCSSLIAVVHDGYHRVVQFSHFSVKEFLTSDRLAASSADISHFHILPNPAHTVIVKSCLGILLRSDIGVVDAEAKNNSPLAKYAAMHWVKHSQFEVSTHLQVGMRRLFDPAKPYFEAWLKLYANDPEWYEFMTFDVERGPPLYYASLYGIRDLVVHLIATHPQHVNTRGGLCLSPLVAALRNRHFDIAELLYQHGADVDIRGRNNRTLLHAASEGGFVDIAQWLLDRCVDARSQQDNHKTLPHLGEATGRPGHCKCVVATDNIDCTPLHLASMYGHFEIARLLIVHGANVNASDKCSHTPLDLATFLERAEIVRLLVEHGVERGAYHGGHRAFVRYHCRPISPRTLSGVQHSTALPVCDLNDYFNNFRDQVDLQQQFSWVVGELNYIRPIIYLATAKCEFCSYVMTSVG
jgi:ankyrin repeat protein